MTGGQIFPWKMTMGILEMINSGEKKLMDERFLYLMTEVCTSISKNTGDCDMLLRIKKAGNGQRMFGVRRNIHACR